MFDVDLGAGFYEPILALIHRKLAHGVDNTHLAMLLTLLAAAAAREDPSTAYETMLLLSDQLRESAELDAAAAEEADA
ncbi:MAG: hypothetical protein IT533_15765 [Hyphomicrobiales bacterium]|nr:hypothetical protein [Hyphomicrobiales bacterium]